MLVSVIMLVLLGLVAYNDFKNRLVPVLLFYGLALTLGIQSIFALTFIGSLVNFLINVGIVLFMIALVYFYFFLKNLTSVNIIDNYIGQGDLFFMIISCLYFSPFLFVVFQVSSIAIMLILFGVYILFSKNDRVLIPLAGGQAAFLVVLELFKVVGFHSAQYDDNLVLINFLYFLW